MKKTLITAGIGLALASPMASALNIDFSGSGNIGGSTYFKEINFGSDNAIIQNQLSEVATTTSATIYAQNAFSFGGTSTDVITYQMILPVVATVTKFTVGVDPAASVSFSLDTTRTSHFNLYLDQMVNGLDTVTTNISTGDGYGDLGGGGLNMGQVNIATGEISGIIGTTGSVASDTTQLGTINPIDTIDGTVNGSAVNSEENRGSMAVNINITTQNRNFVVSELTATSLTVDLQVSDFSFQSAFPTVEASDNVVGYAAKFSSDGGGGLINALTTCVSTKVDNSGTCDGQYQIGSNATFKDKPVPEPMSLALFGLGLGLLGFSRRIFGKS